MAISPAPLSKPAHPPYPSPTFSLFHATHTHNSMAPPLHISHAWQRKHPALSRKTHTTGGKQLLQLSSVIWLLKTYTYTYYSYCTVQKQKSSACILEYIHIYNWSIIKNSASLLPVWSPPSLSLPPKEIRYCAGPQVCICEYTVCTCMWLNTSLCVCLCVCRERISWIKSPLSRDPLWWGGSPPKPGHRSTTKSTTATSHTLRPLHRQRDEEDDAGQRCEDPVW